MEEKQGDILKIAIEEFAKNGYYKAKTDTIAERAKVSKGLVFHYFKTKKNLYHETIQEVIVKLEKVIYNENSPTSSLIELLEYSLKRKLALEKTYPFELQLLLDASTQLEELPEKLKLEIETYVEKVAAFDYEEVIKILQKVPQKNGVFEEDVARLILMVFNESEKEVKKALQNETEVNQLFFDQLMFEAKKQFSILENGYVRENRNFSR